MTLKGKLTLEQAQALIDGDGSLNLSDTPITALPDNLTVGGSLYLSDTQITEKQRSKVRELRDGDYAPGRYLYADGMLLHCKTRRRVHGYDLYVGKIKGQNVVSDGTFYAHCRTLREGIADIAFKRAKDRGAEQFRSLTLDSELTLNDMVALYRIITGACKAGSEAFVSSLREMKERYTVREAIELTRGQYNSERFAEFFGG
nr:MAG TPA: hypothetical protein [Caudoviricetes sp.]